MNMRILDLITIADAGVEDDYELKSETLRPYADNASKHDRKKKVSVSVRITHHNSARLVALVPCCRRRRAIFRIFLQLIFFSSCTILS